MSNPVRSRLALATASLLGAGMAQAGDGSWQIDSSILYYGEQDRVTAVEPVVNARKDLGDEEALNLKLVVDSLTGASHNGAPVRNYAQTFSGPSGSSAYTVPAGEVPLDDSFHDTRGSVSVNWDKPLQNRLWKRSLGVNVSSEYDFFSLGVNGALTRDFNRRNTSLTVGLGYEADTIKPVGGVPVPLSEMGEDEPAASADESRDVTDLLVGITQVINRSTVMQFNYNLSSSSGYHNDPYKILAVDDERDEFWYESRPDARTKHAFYWETKHALANGDIIDGSYRFMTDDWGVSSHTVDLRYRWMLGGDWYLEPHARWYTQSEADFYVESLADEPAPGMDASADYRLGGLTDTTFGAKVGKQLGEGSEVSARLESFQQSGDYEAADLSAIIFELGYSFKW